MLKSDIEFILHIRKECEFLIKHSNAISEDEFYENETLHRAFTRCLEIIGEASKRIGMDFRAWRGPGAPRAL